MYDDDDNGDLTRTPCTEIWWEQCRLKLTDDNLLKIVVEPLKYNQDKLADVLCLSVGGAFMILIH